MKYAFLQLSDYRTRKKLLGINFQMILPRSLVPRKTLSGRLRGTIIDRTKSTYRVNLRLLSAEESCCNLTGSEFKVILDRQHTPGHLLLLLISGRSNSGVGLHHRLMSTSGQQLQHTLAELVCTQANISHPEAAIFSHCSYRAETCYSPRGNNSGVDLLLSAFDQSIARTDSLNESM